MNEMFSYATSFNQSLTNWDVSQVTKMKNIFNYCPNGNYQPDTIKHFKLR